MREWLVAADDRTGAFEVAALFAQVVGPVTVTVGVPPVGSGVVDLGTRAMSVAEATRAAGAVDASPSTWIGHKIDSTLRGNWAAELRARQHATARRMVVMPGWPEMGRTCVGGVVFVDGVAIGSALEQLEDAALIADVNELSEWLAGDNAIAVCDVPSSEAMHAAASALIDEDVLIAGPAGPLGAAFAYRYPTRAMPATTAVFGPVLVVCGSANPVAREQLRRLQIARPDVVVCSTGAPDGALHPTAVATLATHARSTIADLQPRTTIVIGGDTAAALLGDEPRTVVGFAAPGMPWTREGNGAVVITKAGGFGGPDALADLVGGENG